MKNAAAAYKYFNPFWLLILIIVSTIFTLVIVFEGTRYVLLSRQEMILDYYGSVPEFQLFNQEGKVISLKDLKGKIWILSFIFTRCQGPCPIISTNMAKLNEFLKENSLVKLVSITVDPRYDTPMVLSQYAKNFCADPKKWIFLTGPKEKVETLITHGMHQAIIHNSQFGPSPIHSTQLVIVDPCSQMRAFHDGTNPQVLTKICRDIHNLEREFALK